MDIDPRIGDVLKSLSINSSVQVRHGANNAFDIIGSVVRPLLLEFGLPGIYISASRAAIEVIDALMEEGIDPSPMHFIDLVSTSTIGGTDVSHTNISFIDSPVMLEAIMLRTMYFQRARPNEQMFVILDSVHALSIYNEPRLLAEYIHTFVNTFRRRNTLSILFTIPDQVAPEVLANMDLYCTELIDRGDLIIG
ncbi:MAG: hypothetical protein CL992_01520 [Euryarchaeota archaeon]|nr:hypothetical protein [Euryarchaeota archaeon]